MNRSPWPLERVLFALAGSVTIASVVAATLFTPWFLLLTLFVGASQWLFVTVSWCPASLVVERVFNVERGCPR
jgi:hypothetical protein